MVRLVVVAAVSATALEVARLVVDTEEFSRLALPPVIITVIDCDRVIDPSNGPSSPHANGKSGFSVASPQADAEDNDADGVVALPFVVEEVVGVVNDELMILPVVDDADVDGSSDEWSVV